MGNPDLIKDITRKQLEIKNTETSDVLLREMLYNILDIKEDAPTDTQLLPLFNQDLENIFQAFGTFAKNGNMYQNQNTFDKSKILTDFKNWIKDDDNVKTLDART
ncbi:MAG: hypothetical protein LBP53_04630 [Candidatus Peribacteria bacterium]|jgi:hypothetical protein|nr:hypothetical protein [Candidatus Peribacteria bacterium]